jgi:multidrug efflux system outer membrane protein
MSQALLAMRPENCKVTISYQFGFISTCRRKGVKRASVNFLLSVFLLFQGLWLYAAEAELSLTLGDAVERALENNLNLKKSLIDLSSAEYQAQRLWAEIFPSISATVSDTYSSNLFSGIGFEINEKGRSYSIGAGVSLGLNAGTVYAARNIRLAYQNRLLSYEDACNQLEIQVTKDFYSLIADRENLNFLEDTLKLAAQQLEKNQLGFNNGLVNELTVTQSRLALENARYNLSAARSVHENRMREFLASLGIGQDTDAVLEGLIAITRFDADTEARIKQYLPGRPDIVSRRHEIQRLENTERQTALSGRSPSLTLATEWNSSNFDPFGDSLRGSVRLNVPIDTWIPGTKGGQSVRNAKLAIDRAKLDLKITEDGAITHIRSLAANLRNSWDSIEIARLSLQAAQRSYELTELGFRNGTIESLKLEDARNNLAVARQRLLRSELACQTTILDLSAALNIKWKELVK